MKKIIIVFLTFIFFFLGLTEGFIMFGSKSDKKKEVDYVIILGAGLYGRELSPILSNRLDTSLTYINEHPNVKIVVSGGQGENELISEAEAMAEYLISKGVDKKRIIKEDKSTNTYENLRFSKELINKINKKDVHKIMVVSNDFHLFRAKLLAKRNGFKPYGLPSTTIPALKIKYYTRECFAVWKSILLDR